jgi:ABC-type sulfate transport system permease subunit
MLGFVIVIVLEFTAFWTTGNLIFNPEISLFHEPQGGWPIFLTILLAIQALWGLSFLKMACNFLFIQSTFAFQGKQFIGTLGKTNFSVSPSNC